MEEGVEEGGVEEGGEGVEEWRKEEKGHSLTLHRKGSALNLKDWTIAKVVREKCGVDSC